MLSALLADESGQLLPVLVGTVLALLAAGILVFQLGFASVLSAQGQTAADAAALAGGNEVAHELAAARRTTGEDLAPTIINDAAVRAAAADYAQRNRGRLVSYRREGYDVVVSVQTTGTLPAGGASAGVPALDEARSTIGGLVPAGLGPLGGGLGAHPIPAAALAALAQQAGVPVSADSALRRYAGNGASPGPDVADLQSSMQVAILKVEAALGHGLALNSAYRTPAYQAALCAHTAGPCADPGRSLHNVGLAIDVPVGAIPDAVAAQAGLCQPFPTTDPYHYSPVGGPECAQHAGALSGGIGGPQAFGGAVASFLGFDVHLVPLTGAPAALGPLPPGTAGSIDINLSQLQIGCTFFAVGHALGVSQNMLLSAFMAGFAESGMRNLPYGDRDSLGVLQQRASMGWGTVAQEMTPQDAVAMYYRAAAPIDAANPGLAPWMLAQDVQESAFPDGSNYERYLGAAQDLIARVQGGGCPAPAA